MSNKNSGNDRTDHSTISLSRRDVLRTSAMSLGAMAVGTGFGTTGTASAATASSYDVELVSEDVSRAAFYPHGPHAEYVSSEDKTFLVYRGYSADPYAMEFDHSTDEFSDPVEIGTNPLPDEDEHGVPALSIDDDGILHVFFGSHGRSFQYSRSDAAYDISSWTTKDLDSVEGGTYPNTCVHNNNVYCLYRGSPHEHGTLIKSTDGGDSWSEQVVLDFTTGGNDHDDAYVFDLDTNGDKLHMSWTIAFGDSHDTNRKNAYHAYYDTTDSKVYAMDGTSFGSTIDWNEKDSCEVYSSQRLRSVHHVLDGDTVYLIFKNDANDENDYRWRLSTWDGSSWSTQDINGLATGATNSFGEGRINDSGNLEVHLVANGTSIGGDYIVATLESGSWTEDVLIPESPARKPNLVAPVRNGPDEFVCLVSEWADNYDDWGQKMWAVGTDISRREGIYPIDEGSGSTLYDDSGNDRDGSINGPTWDRDIFTGGENSDVLSFAGGTDTVETADDHIRGADEFTQIAWVYLDNTSGDRVISGDYGQGSSSFTHVLWYDDGTDSMSVFLQDSGGNTFRVSDTGTSPPVGEWFQVAWTYNADGSVKVYQNGTETGSTQASGNALRNGTADRQLGGDYGTHPHLEGAIHSVFEWSSEKSSSFIKDDYDGWNTLTAAYPIDEGTGSTVYDASGNGRDGTINGPSWTTDTSTGGNNNDVLSFAGGSDNVETTADHIDNAGQFTQIAWVYLDDKNDDRTVSGDYGKTKKSHSLWYDVGNDSMGIWVNAGDSGKIHDTGTSPPVGEWFQVAWTFNYGELKLYQNGTQIGSTNLGPGVIYDTDSDRQLGGDYGHHPNLVGNLHSVFEWNEVKSSSFIQENYDNW